MKRISVKMLDPIMAPGVTRTAVAPITVTPSALSCSGELYLGPSPATKVATSGVKAFTSTGAAQSVRFPVTMPAAGGVYHAYLDVYVNGLLIGAFIATEDVIIATAIVGPISWE